MHKYGNANYEKQIDDKGTTLVSNIPITKTMEKNASQVVKNSKSQEVVNINDRQTDKE